MHDTGVVGVTRTSSADGGRGGGRIPADDLGKVPEGLLGLFGLVVFPWRGLQSVSAFMVLPAGVAVLAGLHLIAPRPPITTIGLAGAYLIGGFLAGFLGFGLAIAPIGGTPETVAAFYLVAVPMILL